MQVNFRFYFGPLIFFISFEFLKLEMIEILVP